LEKKWLSKNLRQFKMKSGKRIEHYNKNKFLKIINHALNIN
jgi:hypothetical protein